MSRSFFLLLVLKKSIIYQVNPENYRLILSILSKELIKNASGYDVDELKSGTTPNQMTIKSIYNDIDLDSNEIETEFQASFEEVP